MTKYYIDEEYQYSLGDAFPEYLIVENTRVVNDDEYIEIHKDDCSEYEGEIYDFLTKMA